MVFNPAAIGAGLELARPGQDDAIKALETRPISLRFCPAMIRATNMQRRAFRPGLSWGGGTLTFLSSTDATVR